MTIAKKYRSIDEYAAVGIALAKAGHRNMWHAGDWWNAGGKQFGVTARNRLVTQQGWRGYSRDTLKTYGSIAKRFPRPLRYLNADCAHFQTVAPLSDALALPLLERAIHGRWTINRLRIEKKRATGYRRPLTGGHVLRHSFASLLTDLGYSEPTIASLLGHKTHSLTSRYKHSADAVLLAAADAVANATMKLMGKDSDRPVD